MRRLRLALRRIEGDPVAQYKLHRFMARAWIVNAVAVVLVYLLAPPVWAKVSILYLALISIYANWTGDQGACAAADAATDEAITGFAAQEECGDEDSGDSATGQRIGPDLLE